MEMYDLLDQIEQLVEESWHVPLTGKVLIDEGALLECLDRLRTVMPEELRQARLLKQQKERILAEAEQEAEKIIAAGQEQVQQALSKNQVVQEAEKEAARLQEQARQAALELETDARNYAAEILRSLESQLEKTLHTVNQGRLVLEESSAAGDDQILSQ